MTLQVRDGKFDVVVLAGPGVRRWPGLGVRALATTCAELGLSVGLFGGEGLSVKGVLPGAGSGGTAVVQDSQGRIHRVEGRAMVRIVEPSGLPDPFRGWLSPALIPLDTAAHLRERGRTLWTPGVVILGTGNRALQFGSALLEDGVSDVICLERPGAPFRGWEVHRRRFEMLGGKLLRAEPVSLSRKAPMLWDFRVRDIDGVRLLEVSWVVSSGPFASDEGVREYPPESLLFEFEQSSAFAVQEDVEGWALEEQRGRALGAKLVRALGTDPGRAPRRRQRRRESAVFELVHDGKWLSRESRALVQDFPGVPKVEHRTREMASIECIEEIDCRLCQTACPEGAIDIVRDRGIFLKESACSACGRCITACPSRTPILVHEPVEQPRAKLGFSWRGRVPFRKNELAQLVNRRGEAMGSGKILEIEPVSGISGEFLVRVEVPSHLTWEVRSIRKLGPEASAEDEWVMRSEQAAPSRVEVLLRGEKRLLGAGQSLATALFETGNARTGDRLLCRDGSCGLCEAKVDGVGRLACKTTVHRGMSVQLDPVSSPNDSRDDSESICPCSGIRTPEIRERIREGRLGSPDAIRQACGVGEGLCRGRVCMEPFRRLLSAEGIDAIEWIDWRFPWSEWKL